MLTAIPSKRVYITKPVIECFSMSLRKNFIATSPDKNAEIIPATTAAGAIERVAFPVNKSRLSYSAEPKIMGMDSKNENVVAAFFSTP